MNATITKISIGVICSAISGSMAFGISQLNIGKDTALNRQAILNLNQQFIEEKDRTEKRLFHLTEMMEKQTEQNKEMITLAKELISLIKLQNQVNKDH